jgi:diaminohydroxyphosphoribosylaminopyrimidine deaminase/5-amino-6-(5-phosphoribosylamino)uracil reductase
MLRCIELARLGAGSVAPNPLVGCVIIHGHKVIGEGFHEKYGDAHAEVNAINNVKDQSLLPESTLYVNLEPCAHYGKTPPCADFIISKQIPKVVIGTRDPFSHVNGKGIEKLRAAGIEVIENVLTEKCLDLNKRFFLFHQKKRPYIILKWAESEEGFINSFNPVDKKWMTNEASKMLVHKWRAEEQAIMVGTNTIKNDNPSLTTRHWKGNSPLRITFDKDLKLSQSLNFFAGETSKIVFNSFKTVNENNVQFIKLDDFSLQNILAELHNMNIISILVEGGTNLLNQFLKQNVWDEARIFKTTVKIKEGLKSPVFTAIPEQKIKIQSDTLSLYRNC